MNTKNMSRRLAYLLRHDRAYKFDAHGWREVSNLIENHGFSLALLQDIVASNNKQRFEFSEDMRYIRARQGHSIDVDVELSVATPPSTLYHGTAEEFVADILSEGLKPQNRLHVHLSTNVDTAVSVGSRHGTPIVLKVDSGQMFHDGVTLLLSRNGVWLTDYVAPKYLSIYKR
jgi:putative RNA 2'-phosphotransferase